MRFIFIAVNYNGSTFTQEYINSINELSKDVSDQIEIIIVDNDSKKEDKDRLIEIAERNENTKVLWLEKNVGYFKGLNEGIISCTKDSNTFLIIGNNDLTFEKEFILNLKLIDIESDTLVIAPNIITKDGRQQNPHVIHRVTRTEKLKAQIYNSNYYIGQFFKFINQTLIKKLSSQKPKLNSYPQMKIKRGIGACYVLSNNFFNHYEKLDDRVFMWGEEALLSNQVESVNGVTLYDPNIKIIHHESASVKSIESKKKYYMVKESYQIYKKYL
ncbi:glycosyltransferase family 2 protein [Chryseomicrobium excrementi]|uniref:glycosyltransferase family 2 protein n=1 Tax=Chryseomicrobium excrementi TaxID=2041346 RepID=UPI0013FD87E8|nr:glycosyltransferase [Chryseomicrobium excrementi]